MRAGLNETHLLHGTRGNSPFTLAESGNGFDEDGNPRAFYSRGIYFAVRSCYAHSFAHRSADLEGNVPDRAGPFMHLIVARVLRGLVKREANAWPLDARVQPGAARKMLGDRFFKGPFAI